SEDDADIARAFEMGAVDYLRKPVRKFELIARLTTQLELRRRQLHLEQMVNERTQELLVANLELQATQEQLLQADKMAAIGQLAAGVAHEINNPVGFVTSNIGTLSQYLDDLLRIIDGYETAECALPDEQKKNLQVLKKKVDLAYLKSDVSELLEETTDGLSRIKNIVQDMKELSHVSGNAWELADIHDGIESTLNIVHNEIKYKASVVKVFCESARVMCIPSQINQVIMNILVNAAHAIESTGVITIKTAQDDDRLNISISDTGCGMTPDVIKKIFDPFFTTKPVGKGTGLGLSMSYSIVKKHHGNIEVESQPGKGTTFVITLPREQPATGTNNAGI
ncbi:MAG: two-component system, NtrC family, sensor kinase, partial [Pseudomonadota bacterium]|nr:two-component system, NtrC family, sensor kinase [Pseudomonadota bacterium]